MVLPQEADLGGLMNEEESPEEQNLRLAMALLDNDENVLGEILRLYAPNIIEVLYSKFSKRMGVLKYDLPFRTSRAEYLRISLAPRLTLLNGR
jgi:hypothetical protein